MPRHRPGRCDLVHKASKKDALALGKNARAQNPCGTERLDWVGIGKHGDIERPLRDGPHELEMLARFTAKSSDRTRWVI